MESLGSREIQKTKVDTVLWDTLYYILYKIFIINLKIGSPRTSLCLSEYNAAAIVSIILYQHSVLLALGLTGTL